MNPFEIIGILFNVCTETPSMRNLWLILGIMGVILMALAALLLPGRLDGNNTVVLGMMGKTGPDALTYSYGMEKGIFEKYGLAVSYQMCADSYTKMLSLLTGNVDSCITSPGIAAAAYSEGEKITIGMGFGLASNLMLFVKPGSDVESLRGNKLGVMGTNSDSYRITKWYLEGRGLDLETDIELVEIKKQPSLFTSFETGQLEGAVLLSGFAVEAINSGNVVVTTITDAAEEVFGHPAYSTALLLGEKFIERKRVANKYLRAVREIKREIMKNPEEAIQIHAAFAEELPEKMKDVFDIITLVCDIDNDIKEDIIAFTDFGVAQGSFEKTFGDEIFYDGWK
jgi:ABC-type nitrate/sulfonate/bicarbonate transport system substrate-binding protein